jgi:lipid-binding SYLF domain-containing protein
MKRLLVSAMLGSAALLSACQSAPKTDDEKIASQDELKAMAVETLDKLESLQPGSRKTVQSAYGYAVFSNFGMKILVAGGGSGKGFAQNNSTKEVTYMRMAEVQAGLGMGVKKFKLVWVFANKEAFDSFVNKGWEFGGQGTAQAQAGEKGAGAAGALPVSPGVSLYQITDTGLALELTVKGTKYYKDDGLN